MITSVTLSARLSWMLAQIFDVGVDHSTSSLTEFSVECPGMQSSPPALNSVR